MRNTGQKTIYLDHASTTFLDPRVLKAMEPFLHEEYGNPSSLYEKGMQARFALDDARVTAAKVLNCRPEEIIFTAGGTESINLAIFGVVRKALLKNTKSKPHIITTQIEHHAVLRSFEALAEEGVEVTYLPVDKSGSVELAALKRNIKPNTVLVSIMYANNEIGTVQPLTEIAKIIRKENSGRQSEKRIFFHSDACQAGGVLNIDVQKLGLDLMSLNGSKIYGPKQTGCLYVRNGTSLRPIIFGGGQEKDLRPGTENVAGIVGFASALKIGDEGRIKENKRLRNLRNAFVKDLKKKNKGIELNGPELSTDTENKPSRLPNNIHISIDGVEGEALMLYLDAKNIAVSTGSACSSTSADVSHVILAITGSKKKAAESIRITLGRKTTQSNLKALLAALTSLVPELRRVSKLSNHT